MKSVIQNIVAVAVIAATTYTTTIYAVDHATTHAPTPVVVDSPVVPTCQELFSNNMEIKSCSGRVEAVPVELTEMACNASKYEGNISITFNGADVRCYK